MTNQEWIQDLASGGGQLLRLKSCQCSEMRAEQVICGKGPGSFWVFNAQIYAFSHILETLFFSFFIASSKPKVAL